MPWIQVRVSDNRVTRIGKTKRDYRPNTTDYEVDALPARLPGDVLTYDGTAFAVDSTQRIAATKAALEPELLTAHARWQSAVTLSLDCEPHCRMKYQSLRAEYDALGGT